MLRKAVYDSIPGGKWSRRTQRVGTQMATIIISNVSLTPMAQKVFGGITPEGVNTREIMDLAPRRYTYLWWRSTLIQLCEAGLIVEDEQMTPFNHGTVRRIANLDGSPVLPVQTQEQAQQEEQAVTLDPDAVEAIVEEATAPAPVKKVKIPELSTPANTHLHRLMEQNGHSFGDGVAISILYAARELASQRGHKSTTVQDVTDAYATWKEQGYQTWKANRTVETIKKQETPVTTTQSPEVKPASTASPIWTDAEVQLFRAMYSGSLYRAEIAKKIGLADPKQLQPMLDRLTKSGVLVTIKGSAGRYYQLAVMNRPDFMLDLGQDLPEGVDHSAWVRGKIDAQLDGLINGSIPATMDAVGQDDTAKDGQEVATVVKTQDAAVSLDSVTETLILNAMDGSTEPMTKTQIARMSPELKKRSSASTKAAYERLVTNGKLQRVADGFVLAPAEDEGAEGAEDAPAPAEESAVTVDVIQQAADVAATADALIGIAERVAALDPADGICPDDLRSELDALSLEQRAEVRRLVIERVGSGTGDAGARFNVTGLNSQRDMAAAIGSTKKKEEAKKEQKAKEQKVAKLGAKQYIRFTPSYKAAEGSVCHAASMAAFGADAKKVLSSDDLLPAVQALREDAKKVMAEVMSLLVKRGVLETVSDKDGNAKGYRMPAEVRKAVKASQAELEALRKAAAAQ